MKATCNRNLLLQALTEAGRTADGRRSASLENCAQLRASQGAVEVTAANIHQTVTSIVPALVEAEGEAAAPAVILRDLLQSLPPDSQVKLENGAGRGTLNVRCNNSETNILGPEELQYPETAHHAYEGAILNFEPSRLRAAIKSVQPVIGSEKDRPSLQAMLLMAEGKEFTTAATDGYRMAADGDELDEETPEPVRAALPAAAAKELARLLANLEEPVQAVIQQESNKATFTFLNRETGHNTRYTTQLLRDELPDLLNFVPSAYETKVTLDSRHAASAIQTLHPFARNASRAAKLIIPADGGQEARLSAKSEEEGWAAVDLPVKRREGPDNRIAFNSKFIMDVMPSIAGDELELELSGPSKPGVFRDPARRRYVCVVMPMFLQWDEDEEEEAYVGGTADAGRDKNPQEYTDNEPDTEEAGDPDPEEDEDLDAPAAAVQYGEGPAPETEDDEMEDEGMVEYAGGGAVEYEAPEPALATA